MTFRLPYALATVMIFVIEVLIALFVHDGFVRPYIGDVLAVILVYVALRAVLPWPVWLSAVAALGFALAIEFGQLFHLLDALGLRGNRLALVVMGGSFEIWDLVCYAVGISIAMAVELAVRRKRA